MSVGARAASVIIPAYREAENIRPLVERLTAAFRAAEFEVEIIIIDDNSGDGTEEVVASLAAQFPVRLIVRRGERGLATAVLTGFRHAKFDRFVVMDADLQHPPESAPELVRRLDGACDFVIGSRYGTNGEVDKAWPWIRRFASGTATLLARPLVPLSDPMTGFFALHRKTWEESKQLDPIGYKIALELYVKGGCRRPSEVPIQFASRAAGETKFGPKEVMRYLRHLIRLYRFRFPWLVMTLLVIVFLCIVLGVFWSAHQ